MMNKITFLPVACAVAAVLSGCMGDSAVPPEQIKAPATEPANHTLASANRFITPLYENGTASSGVLGTLEAGEEDYYYVEVDYFDTGDHEFRLTGLTDDLDMTVTDWDGMEYTSAGSGTGDEVVTSVSTSGLGFFSDKKRIVVKISGKSATSTSRFRLEMRTTD
ncbi:MAG: hypothetical protein LRY66_11230 [Saccharospirillaceae bacterium]|nr:hypothetical protein [Saccharospirillaceae bacterium]MCD8531896.1 hypothetical protein [Saccharospirillaceae bacterium]